MVPLSAESLAVSEDAALVLASALPQPESTIMAASAPAATVAYARTFMFYLSSWLAALPQPGEPALFQNSVNHEMNSINDYPQEPYAGMTPI